MSRTDQSGKSFPQEQEVDDNGRRRPNAREWANPFAATTSQSGQGMIHLAQLAGGLSRLRAVHYQYPLKLISPAPITIDDPDTSRQIHTVYLLTYGGGIVAGDRIDLQVHIESGTRLVLLTQGSTKLFKSADRTVTSTQRMSVKLDPGAALCYLPDPVQPFEHSSYTQHQTYNFNGQSGSLCYLDWVTNGRPANGENWSFYRYRSYNEIYVTEEPHRRLLLRDNLILDDRDGELSLKDRMADISVYGTLTLHGPLFKALSDFFLDEFKLLPRVGARQWDDHVKEEPKDMRQIWRKDRIGKESSTRLLWSAALIRGCVVVKFGALQLEHGRHWLYDMLNHEGSIAKLFGDRALLCLR